MSAMFVWVLLSVLSGLIGALVAAETSAWSGRLHGWLIRRAANGLPLADRHRYNEEWLAELAEVPNGPLTRLWWCMSLVSRRTEMRRALRGRHAGSAALGKRVLDVGVSALALLILLPLLAGVALGLRIEGGSGVICGETRVGGDGRPFQLLRFRALVGGPGRRRFPGVIHRFVYWASINELPQLWNVVRGEMSLVGPAPRRPSGKSGGGQVGREVSGGARAGLVWMAAAYPADSDAERLARYREYAVRWSLRRDVAVVLRIVLRVIRGR